jgi:hypothetical protein
MFTGTFEQLPARKPRIYWQFRILIRPGQEFRKEVRWPSIRNLHRAARIQLPFGAVVIASALGRNDDNKGSFNQ